MLPAVQRTAFFSPRLSFLLSFGRAEPSRARPRAFVCVRRCVRALASRGGRGRRCLPAWHRRWRRRSGVRGKRPVSRPFRVGIPLGNCGGCGGGGCCCSAAPADAVRCPHGDGGDRRRLIASFSWTPGDG